MAGSFGDALKGEDEVRITVVRSKGGKTRTLPVWFAVRGDTLELLPMHGLATVWYMDMEKAGTMTVRAKGSTIEARPKVVLDPKLVQEVKDRFGQKYGKDDVRKYYPTSEVALEVSLK